MGKYLGFWAVADVYAKPPRPIKDYPSILRIDKQFIVLTTGTEKMAVHIKYDYTYDSDSVPSYRIKLRTKKHIIFSGDVSEKSGGLFNEDIYLYPKFSDGYFLLEASDIGTVAFVKVKNL